MNSTDEFGALLDPIGLQSRAGGAESETKGILVHRDSAHVRPVDLPGSDQEGAPPAEEEIQLNEKNASHLQLLGV